MTARYVVERNADGTCAVLDTAADRRLRTSTTEVRAHELAGHLNRIEDLRSVLPDKRSGRVQGPGRGGQFPTPPAAVPAAVRGENPAAIDQGPARLLIPGVCRHCGHFVTANSAPYGTGRCGAPMPGDGPDAVCGCSCSYITEAEAGAPW